LITELPLQDVDLMAQGQDLDVLRSVGHRQQPQRGEGVGDREVGETEQRAVIMPDCGHPRPDLC
jgi:hypothetical protein